MTLTLESTPRLGADVVMDSAGDGAVVVSVGGVPVSRVSTRIAALLRALDGRTPLGAFADPPELDGARLLDLVRRIDAAGLLEGSTRRPPGRLVFRPPLTLQLATLSAPRIFRALDRPVRTIARRWLVIPAVVVLLAGLVALVAQHAVVARVVTSPASLPGLVAVVCALVLATVLHEAAHGATLTRWGELPRRAGVMLFYLSPAFFVDVTNGWRLPHRAGRVAVALAGPAVHALIAAASAIAALFSAHSGLRDAFVLLSLAALSITAVNLVPFVRFDGYLALMSALDEPQLRSRALADAGAFLGRALLGVRAGAKRLDRPWSVPFGLASAVVPMALVALALERIARGLAGLGFAGTVGIALLALVVAGAGGAWIVRRLRAVVAAGAAPARVALVTTGILASLTGALFVPVPSSITLGFTVEADRVVLVDGSGSVSSPAVGDRVSLSTNGLLWSAPLGTAVVGRARGSDGVAPVSAILPVTVPGVGVPVRVVAEVEVPPGSPALPPAGLAHLSTGVRPLWLVVWDAAVGRS